MRYSVQSRNLIFVKCYGFFHFAENMVKNIGKNISKNLNGNYSQKLLDHAKQFATDALKTSLKKVIQKKAVIWLVVKLQGFQKIHNRIIYKQLQIDMIKKITNERKTGNY